ncbi:hypothetical protein KIL84_002368 [Mauremys mutica]|uniref:Uncharacterized protein n=1 Tax=Mauremys mutica TaxID=74926 RepID=A0A9D4AY55_9SAUR|nr:hypothetical protein KIL84_002368 [Mauremys mutica]
MHRGSKGPWREQAERFQPTPEAPTPYAVRGRAAGIPRGAWGRGKDNSKRATISTSLLKKRPSREEPQLPIAVCTRCRLPPVLCPRCAREQRLPKPFHAAALGRKPGGRWPPAWAEGGTQSQA